MNENKVLFFSTILLFLSAIIFAHFSLKSDNQYEDKVILTRKVDSLINCVDSVRYIKDSLYDELYVESIKATRYEVALEYLKEESPLCANAYEYIISTKTE
jgi:hypothetical protein